MALADMAVGVNQALQAQRARAAKEQDLQSLLAQRVFEQQMREREFAQRQQYQTESLASLKAEREANAELRRQNAASQLSEDLMPGDRLDPNQVGILRGGGRGSLLEERDPTLPSRSTIAAGVLTPGGTPTGAGPAPRGFLRTVQRPGRAGGAFYLGSGPQRRTQAVREQLRGLVDRLPENSPERQALEYQLLTGDNPPAGMFERDVTPSFQLQPIYDESGRPSGAVRFNQRTGAVEPVELPGAGIRAGAGGRDALPPRVQNYLVQLQAQHPTDYAAAQAELADVLSHAPDETFDRIAAANALRALYAQPSGARDQGPPLPPELANLFADRPTASPGGRRAAPLASAGAVAGGQPITAAELRAVAARLGISEDEAAQQARARGMQVR